MNEAVAVEPEEKEQTFAGQKLRKRKPKGKVKSAPKTRAQVEETLEKTQKANEALADISEVLDPEVPSIIIVTMPDGSERDVNIFKCKARQIGYVMKFLASAFKAMDINSFDDAQAMTTGLTNPARLLTLLSAIMDDAIGTASMLTDINENDFLELEIDDALAVVLAVWHVNQAFFLARVLPMIQEMIGRGELDSPEKTPPDMEISTLTK